jgi:DNA polymerase V
MSHGGKRPNAGRKTSASPYREKTSVIRVHNSIKPEVPVYLDSYKKKLFSNLDTSHMPQALPNPPKQGRPIYSGKISAGQSRFPSPAQDYEQKFLDLNERYISNPPATFFFEVKGNSMEGAGIFEGDTVIVDRAVKPKSSSIIIADVDGEWMVKRLYKRGNVVKLLSENPEHAPIVLAEGQELVIFGVVMYVIHQPK